MKTWKVRVKRNNFFTVQKLLALIFLFLVAVACTDDEPQEVDSIGTLNNLNVAPDMGTGSAFAGTGNQGFAGIGAIGFPPTSGGNNKFFAFDTSTKTWSEKVSLPLPKRYNSLMFATSTNKIYVLGGYNNYSTGGGVNEVSFHKDVWQYEIGADQWTQKNDLPIDPEGIKKCIVMNIDGVGFLIYKNKFWRYNELTDTWEGKPDLPFTVELVNEYNLRTSDYGLSTTLSKGYVNVDNTIWEYDLNSETWKQLMPFSERILFCLEDKGYYAREENDSTYLWDYNFQDGISKVKSKGIKNIMGAYIGLSFASTSSGYFSIERRTYMAGFYEFTP